MPVWQRLNKTVGTTLAPPVQIAGGKTTITKLFERLRVEAPPPLSRIACPKKRPMYGAGPTFHSSISNNSVLRLKAASSQDVSYWIRENNTKPGHRTSSSLPSFSALSSCSHIRTTSSFVDTPFFISLLQQQALLILPSSSSNIVLLLAFKKDCEHTAALTATSVSVAARASCTLTCLILP